MELKSVIALLNEKESTTRYWTKLLVKEGLISPERGFKQKLLYSESDLQTLQKLQRLLRENRNWTTTQAIDLLKGTPDPQVLLSQYEATQKQLAAVQSKVIQLRKPFWIKVKSWLTSIFGKVKETISPNSNEM